MAEHDQHSAHDDVGSAWSIGAVAGLILFLGLIGWFVTTRVRGDEHRSVHLATGVAGGTYATLGARLVKALIARGATDDAGTISSDGSAANMQLVANAKANFAFVQSDTPAVRDARLVASLYDEVLHVLARADANIRDLTDLHGRVVSVGKANSGTRQVAERVLRHFAIDVEERTDLDGNTLAQAFRDKTIDAAFILQSVPSPIVDDLCDAELVRLIPLGDGLSGGGQADALAIVHPSFRALVLPRGTYGRVPRIPTRTVAVGAQLIARADLPDDFVRDVTKALFDSRLDLIGRDSTMLPAATQIHEDWAPQSELLPYHAGAEAYYRREEPTFFVQYAEAISLGGTIVFGLISAVLAFREWMRRRKKNRIDVYYLRVRDLAARARSSQPNELLAIRDGLDAVRQDAFADLVAERVEANESFTIFQDFLRGELSTIDTRLARTVSS